MFGLFRKSEESPVEETRRQWIDECFVWMIHEFGEETIKSRRVLTPSADDFPIEFLASEKNAFELLDIVAEQMELDPESIDIDFYQEGQSELATGAGAYSRVFLKPADHEKTSAGCYRGKDEDGDYLIGLNSRSMQDAESLVATIAHGEARKPRY